LTVEDSLQVYIFTAKRFLGEKVLNNIEIGIKMAAFEKGV